MVENRDEELIGTCLSNNEREVIHRCLEALKAKGEIGPDEFRNYNFDPPVEVIWKESPETGMREVVIVLHSLSPEETTLEEGERSAIISRYYSRDFDEVGAKFDMPEVNLISISW